MTDNKEKAMDEVQKIIDLYNKAWKDGYSAGRTSQTIYDKGYKQGVKDLWQCIQVLTSMTWKECYDTFGSTDPLRILLPQDFMSRLKDKEAKDV